MLNRLAHTVVNTEGATPLIKKWAGGLAGRAGTKHTPYGPVKGDAGLKKNPFWKTLLPDVAYRYSCQGCVTLTLFKTYAALGKPY